MSRCSKCGAPRVPLDREATKFGACTFIECSDPLYDYEREQTNPPAADAAQTEPEPRPDYLELCVDCSHKFGVWFAENPVWNQIIPERVGMLCPCCFIARADKQGFRTTGWKLVPMDHPLGEESVEQPPERTGRLSARHSDGIGGACPGCEDCNFKAMVEDDKSITEAREWMQQTGEYATELRAAVGPETYQSILETMAKFGEDFRDASEAEELAAANAELKRLNHSYDCKCITAEIYAAELATLRKEHRTADSFWVVERFENNRSAGYWDGGSSRDFQMDIEKAIQFRRKEDAFWATRGWHWKDVKLTEHLMMDAELRQREPAEGER